MSSYRFVIRLLERWEYEKKNPGIDYLVSLQRIMDLLPEEADIDLLKGAIIPLLAKNRAEQIELNKISDEIREQLTLEWKIGQNNEGGENYIGNEDLDGIAKSWRNAWIFGAVVVIIAVFITGLPLLKVSEKKDSKVRTDSIPVLGMGIPEGTTKSAPRVKISNEEIPPDIVRIPPIDYRHLKVFSTPSLWDKIYLEQTYRFLFKTGLIFLLSGLLYLIVWWTSYKKKLVLYQDGSASPPFGWEFNPQLQKQVEMGEDLFLIIRNLKKRAETENLLLDIQETVRVTSLNSGRVEFQYKKLTRVPEYLILIDRRSEKNHQAKLFELIYQTLLSEEVHVERFYFDGDIRICWNELYPQGTSLNELNGRFPDHRLLVFSKGYTLLNPKTGNPATWVKPLLNWQKRALLTSQATRAWGRREQRLANYFLVLPSGLEGLKTLIEKIEINSEEKPFRSLQIPIHKTEPIRFKGTLKKTLENHYGPMMIRWISACAIWPSLHWDLTLYLGEWLGKQAVQDLLTLENLTNLSRLAWFSEGHIPDSARSELMDMMDPEESDSVRAYLNQLMEKSSPPFNSVALDKHRMHVVTNQLMRNDLSKATRQMHEKELLNLLGKGIEHDFTVIDYLDRPRTQLDFWVPDSFRKYVYPGGKPFYGWKSIIWGLPIWLLGCLLIMFYNPDIKPSCEGDSFSNKNINETYCLNNDSARFQLIKQEQNFPVQDSDTLYNWGRKSIIDPVYLDSINWFFGANYYNLAVKAYTVLDSSLCRRMLTESFRYDSLSLAIGLKNRLDYRAMPFSYSLEIKTSTEERANTDQSPINLMIVGIRDSFSIRLDSLDRLGYQQFEKGRTDRWSLEHDKNIGSLERLRFFFDRSDIDGWFIDRIIFTDLSSGQRYNFTVNDRIDLGLGKSMDHVLYPDNLSDFDQETSQEITSELINADSLNSEPVNISKELLAVDTSKPQPNDIPEEVQISDTLGPQINIQTPVLNDGDTIITIQNSISILGNLIDTAGIKSLFVNNTQVILDEQGRFSASVNRITDGDININEIIIKAYDLNENSTIRKFYVEWREEDSLYYTNDPNSVNKSGRSFLLLIGINRYKYWDRLHNAVKDCDDIHGVLTGEYQFNNTDVITLYNQEATRENILETFALLQDRIRPYDDLLIYYSGHGFYDPQSELGYWVPVNARLTKIPDFIRNSTILDYLRTINSKNTLLIVDADYAGTIFANSRGSIVEGNRSRWAFTSGDIEKVFRGVPGENSPFARYLIRYLSNNRKLSIGAEELIKNIRSIVERNTAQTPMGSPLKSAGDEGGQFRFYRRAVRFNRK